MERQLALPVSVEDFKEIRQDDCERRKTIEQQEKDSQANLSNIKSESEVTINNKIDGDQ